jgi:hypothetical protein
VQELSSLEFVTVKRKKFTMAENDTTTRIALSRPCDSGIANDTSKSRTSGNNIVEGAGKLLLDDKETEEDGGNISSDNSATASVSSTFSSSSLTSSSDDCSSSSNNCDTNNDNVSNSFDDRATTTNLWWIHGDGYDLNDFVQVHPGGIEAILLGKGRDCTALVESYHPFSVDRVWKILEKHRSCHNVSRCQNNDDDEKEKEKENNYYNNNNKKKDDEKSAAAIKRTTITTTTTTTNTEFESMTEIRQQEEQQQHQQPGGGRVPDFFYEILKKRVAKVLRSNGIDPLKDRGASTIRIVYYLMIFILWSYAGYLHCNVRFFHFLNLLFFVLISILNFNTICITSHHIELHFFLLPFFAQFF